MRTILLGAEGTRSDELHSVVTGNLIHVLASTDLATYPEQA